MTAKHTLAVLENSAPWSLSQAVTANARTLEMWPFIRSKICTSESVQPTTLMSVSSLAVTQNWVLALPVECRCRTQVSSLPCNDSCLKNNTQLLCFAAVVSGIYCPPLVLAPQRKWSFYCVCDVSANGKRFDLSKAMLFARCSEKGSTAKPVPRRHEHHTVTKYEVLSFNSWNQHDLRRAIWPRCSWPFAVIVARSQKMTIPRIKW